jgi:uncharacterized membrane protein YgaE (UPF0421/DUF939 family)
MNFLQFKPRIVYHKEALRIALAMCVGLIIYKVFHLSHGYWILLTINVIYMGTMHSFVMGRLNSRILGTFLGLSFGILFIVLFCHYNYHYLYLIPVILFIVCYAYFISGFNYVYMAFFISMFIVVIEVLATPHSANMNLSNVVFSRLSGTIIGTVIIVFFETVMFPVSTGTKYTIYPLVNNVLKKSILAVEAVAANFINNKKNNSTYWAEIELLSTSIMDIEKLYKAGENEIFLNTENLVQFGKIFTPLYEFLDCLRGMSFICNHKEGKLEFSRKILQNINNTLLEKHKSIPLNKNLSEEYFKTSQEFSNIKNRETCEYLFVLQLHSALRNLDEIRNKIGILTESARD